MHRIAFSLALLVSTSVFAEELSYVEPVDNADLSQGVCADPSMTDDQRAEMVARSRADAIRCMGEAWVEADEGLVQPAAVGGLSISANIAINRISVIDRDGEPHTFLTSPGTRHHPTLEWSGVGPFRVEGPDYVVQDQEKDYVGAPMPWAVFYKGGYAFHGTDQVRRLGRPASHGCLRMRTEDAAWLNAQVRVANNSSVKVNVFNSAPAPKPKPRVARPVAPRYRDEDPYARPTPRYREESPYDYYERPNYERPYNPWGL